MRIGSKAINHERHEGHKVGAKKIKLFLCRNQHLIRQTRAEVLLPMRTSHSDRLLSHDLFGHWLGSHLITRLGTLLTLHRRCVVFLWIYAT